MKKKYLVYDINNQLYYHQYAWKISDINAHEFQNRNSAVDFIAKQNKGKYKIEPIFVVE